jgi:hypothetical protein
MSSRRRRAARTASLTPLLDVLFILLFASLIQAHGAIEKSAVRATELAHEGSMAGTGDAGAPDAGAFDAAAGDAGTPDGRSTAIAIASAPDETAYLLRSRIAAEALSDAILGMDIYTLEVSERGRVFAISRKVDGDQTAREPFEHQLLRRVPAAESAAEYEYVGFGGFGICTLVRDHFALQTDASRRPMVMVMLTVPFADLPLALARGLKRDLSRCLGDAGGVGMLVQPGDEDDHGI